MGCFDELALKCPKCKEITIYQSKSGECMLHTYSLSDAPLEIIADANVEGLAGRLYCEHCQAQLVVNVKFIATVGLKDGVADDDEMREV